MGVKITNNARTFLTSGLSNSATTVVVDDTVAFPDVSADEDYFFATLYNSNGDVEIVKVNSTDANSMTVERGQQDTDPAGWDVNDNIELRLTAGTLTEFIQQLPPNLDIATGRLPFGKLFVAEAPTANSAYMGYDPTGINPDGDAEGVFKWRGHAEMARGIEALEESERLDYDTGLKNKPSGGAGGDIAEGSIEKRHLARGAVDFTKVELGTLGWQRMNLRGTTPSQFSVIGWSGADSNGWRWHDDVPIRVGSIAFDKLEIHGDPTDGQTPQYDAVNRRFQWGGSNLGYSTHAPVTTYFSGDGHSRLVFRSSKFLTHSHFGVVGGASRGRNNYNIFRCSDLRRTSQYYAGTPPPGDSTSPDVGRDVITIGGRNLAAVIVQESADAEDGKLYVSGGEVYIFAIDFFNFA